jgi:hypothetical protein
MMVIGVVFMMLSVLYLWWLSVLYLYDGYRCCIYMMVIGVVFIWWLSVLYSCNGYMCLSSLHITNGGVKHIACIRWFLRRCFVF